MEYKKEYLAITKIAKSISPVMNFYPSLFKLKQVLFTNNWGYSWVIWVVAGVVFPAVVVVTNLFCKKKGGK